MLRPDPYGGVPLGAEAIPGAHALPQDFRSDLHALSDRTLKDIGLTRGEIDSLFRS